MSSFPPNSWEVRFLEDWSTFSASPPEVVKLHTAALMTIRFEKFLMKKKKITNFEKYKF